MKPTEIQSFISGKRNDAGIKKSKSIFNFDLEKMTLKSYKLN